EAEKEAIGIFRIIRKKVQRFITVISGNTRAKLIPIDWIYKVYIYSMYIRFNIPAGGIIN
ncbi:hypothetical protein BKA59DRAFT_387157, partial [Fusarium tricinctum]